MRPSRVNLALRRVVPGHAPVLLFLLGLMALASRATAQSPAVPTEQSFEVGLGQPFFLDHYGGPAVQMVLRNADVAFVDANWTDELGRGWNVHTPKHSSVSGREGNLTLLFRHPQSGFEVYYLSSLSTPHGQATIVVRGHR